MLIGFLSIIILRAHQRTQFLPTTIYHVSANKRQVSNKRRPLISAAPLGILIEISVAPFKCLPTNKPISARLLEITPYINGSLTKITYETSTEPVEPCPNCWYLNSSIVFGWLTARFYVFFMFLCLLH